MQLTLHQWRSSDLETNVLETANSFSGWLCHTYVWQLCYFSAWYYPVKALV